MFATSVRFLALACLAGSSLSAVAQDKLQWKFRANETLKYSVVQNMTTIQKVGDQTRNAVMNQAMDMSWQVLGASAAGDTVMNQIVNRIRMKMDNGPAGVIEFDTQSDEKPANPAIARTGQTFEKIVQKPFQVTMKQKRKIRLLSRPRALRPLKSPTRQIWPLR